MKEKRNAKDEENNQSPTKMGPGLTNDMMKNIQSPGSLHQRLVSSVLESI